MKIGIYPGSFDPLHLSHLKTIELSFLQLKLDKLFLIPIINLRKNQTPIKTRIKLLEKYFSNNKKISIISFKKLDYWNFIDNLIDQDPKHAYFRLMGETCYNSYPEVGTPPLRDEPDTLKEILRNQTIVIMPNPATIHKIIKAKDLNESESKKIIILDIGHEENYAPVFSVTEKIKKNPVQGLKELKYNEYYKSSKSLNFLDWEKLCWAKTGLKIGISHGTFNKPHEGHLKLWEIAKKQLNLDCVFVWPSLYPYHKLNSRPFIDRYKLLEEKLAFHSDVHLLPIVKEPLIRNKIARHIKGDSIRDIFNLHEGIVDWLASQLPFSTEYYRLFGSDSVLEYLNKYGDGQQDDNPLITMLSKGKIAVLERADYPLPVKILSKIVRLKHSEESVYFYGLSNTKSKAIEKEFGLVRVRETESKHVPQGIISPKIKKLTLLAKKVGYKYSKIGIHKKYSKRKDIDVVRRLVQNYNFRPIKFVISKDGKIWADNSHWAMASLIRYGWNSLIKDVPHYFIDLRTEFPLVINKPDSLKMPELKISVEYAQEIQQRLDKGWRPDNIKYTIGELFKEGGYDDRK